MTPLFSHRSTKQILLGLLCAAVLFTPLLALAADVESTDLRSQAENVSKQIAIVPRFIAVVAYVIAAYFAFKGLLALRKFIDNADENPITKALSYILIAAFLIALPYVINITLVSLKAQKACVRSASDSFCDKGFGKNSCSTPAQDAC